MMTKKAQLLEDSLLVIWNDRDASRRLESMQKVYAPDIHFFETDTAEAIIGHQAVNEIISKLQSGWPIEFKFELNRQSQVNHQVQVISWNLGPQGATAVATGKDVAIVENNLIKYLNLFLDKGE